MIVPLTTTFVENHIDGKLLKYGQHDDRDRLNGLGRKLWVSPTGQTTMWDGEFVNDRGADFCRVKIVPGNEFFYSSINKIYDDYVNRNPNWRVWRISNADGTLSNKSKAYRPATKESRKYWDDKLLPGLFETFGFGEKGGSAGEKEEDFDLDEDYKV